VDLVTRDDGVPGPAGVRVHRVPCGDDGPGFARRVTTLRRIDRIRPYRYGLWSLAVARRLLEIDVGRPDVIEFVDCQAEGLVALTDAGVRRRFAGVPMVVWAHTPMFVEEDLAGSGSGGGSGGAGGSGGDPGRFGRSIYHRWEREALAAADGVCVTSRLARARFGRPDASVIPLPVKPVAPGPIPGGPPRVVFLGSVNPRKGADVWGHSLARLLRRRPDVRAELIGPDTTTAPGGGSMTDEIVNALPRDLRDRLHARGPLGHDAAMAAVAGAALVVVPSRFESFSLAGAETLARGRPLLVSDKVGLREYASGLPCAAAGDADALADAQERLLAAPARAHAHAAEPRRQMLAACAPEIVLDARAAWINGLAPGSRGDQPGRATVEMARFLSRIEREEAAARTPVSSAGS